MSDDELEAALVWTGDHRRTKNILLDPAVEASLAGEAVLGRIGARLHQMFLLKRVGFI